jgi:hypothetical protein
MMVVAHALRAKSWPLGVICILATCVDLTLGLWPFHAPKNDVAWLEGTNGILLGKNGSVPRPEALSREPLPNAGATIEIWVQPSIWNESSTLLALRAPDGYPITRLHQSLTDLAFDVEDPASVKPDRGKTRVYVDNALQLSLRQKKPVFVTITSGANGSSVYLDGALELKGSPLSIPPSTLTGSMILGDSPRQPDSFQGQIRGLAIFNTELDAAGVIRHFKTWTQTGRPEVTREDEALAVYLFDERAGDLIHNSVGKGGALQIPSQYTVVEKIALEPFWKEFDFSGTYWSGNMKNVVGFIPLGFCYYAFWTARRSNGKAFVIAVLLGLLVSLTIEVLQIFLPTRDSGTTDLFTNTFGTYLGVLFYQKAYIPLTAKVPELGFFLPAK